MSSEDKQIKDEETFKKKATITMILVTVALIVIYAMIRIYK